MKKMLLVSLCMALVVTMHAQTLPAYLPTNGLVGWWPFNGNANDESGNGNHGTVNGATLTADRSGQNLSAYNFSSNSFIQIPYSSSLNSIQNGLTMSAWVLMDGGSSAPRIMELRGAYGGGGDAGFAILAHDNSNVSRSIEARWYNNFGNTNISVWPSQPVSSLNWHHLVFSCDGVLGVGNFYVDGELYNTNYQFDNQGPITSCYYNNNSLFIGAEPNLATFFGGKLDDIAIYNRALTPSEITALYNGTTGVSGCTNATACNYNAAATLDDGSCTFPTQTYLNCDGTCINDTDADGICNELETPTLPTYLPSNGLVGWWPFNGNANDESGNGNHGTVNGATLTVDRNGGANSAYSFDGVSNEIEINDNLILDQLTQSPFSLSLWYNAGTLSGDNFDGLISRGWENSSNFFGFQIGRSNNEISYQTNGPNCSGSIHTTSPGIWVNIVQIYDVAGGFIKSYVNGELQSTQTSCSALVSQVNNDNSLMLGVEREGNLHFNGLLDDIAIYNRALTQEEISALYTGTSSNNNGGGGGGTVGTPAASVPAGIPYQAVIRDNAGLPLINAPVTVRFTLHQNTTDGTVEYQEAHALTTNAFGLVNTLFGSGTASQGSFANINWSATTKFVQVEANSGAGYVDMGTQQMMSVPFAMKSNESNKSSVIQNANLPIYANNAAALAGGLVAGEMYRTATGDLKIVY